MEEYHNVKNILDNMHWTDEHDWSMYDKFYDFCIEKFKYYEHKISNVLIKIVARAKHLSSIDKTKHDHRILVETCCNYYLFHMLATDKMDLGIAETHSICMSELQTYHTIYNEEMYIMEKYREMSTVCSQPYPSLTHYMNVAVMYLHATLMCSWDNAKRENKRLRIRREHNSQPVEILEKFNLIHTDLSHAIKEGSIPNELNILNSPYPFNPHTYTDLCVIYPSDYTNFLRVSDSLITVKRQKPDTVYPFDIPLYVFFLIMQAMSDMGLLIFYKAVKFNHALAKRVRYIISQRTIFSWIEYTLFSSLTALFQTHAMTALQIGDTLVKTINLNVIIKQFPNLSVLAIDTPCDVTLNLKNSSGFRKKKLPHLKCLRLFINSVYGCPDDLYEWIMRDCHNLKKLCLVGMSDTFTPRNVAARIPSTIDHSNLEAVCTDVSICKYILTNTIVCVNCLTDVYRVAVINHKKQRDSVKTTLPFIPKSTTYPLDDHPLVHNHDYILSKEIEELTRLRKNLTIHHGIACNCPPGLFNFLHEAFSA